MLLKLYIRYIFGIDNRATETTDQQKRTKTDEKCFSTSPSTKNATRPDPKCTGSKVRTWFARYIQEKRTYTRERRRVPAEYATLASSPKYPQVNVWSCTLPIVLCKELLQEALLTQHVPKHYHHIAQNQHLGHSLSISEDSKMYTRIVPRWQVLAKLQMASEHDEPQFAGAFSSG